MPVRRWRYGELRIQKKRRRRSRLKLAVWAPGDILGLYCVRVVDVPSHHLLGFLDYSNGAVAAPLTLHALSGSVLLLESSPAVSWLLGGRVALGPPGGGWSLGHGVVVLLIQGLCTGQALLDCFRFRLGCLAAHAAAIASVAVEEQKPDAHPNECNDRDDADDNEYGDGGSRDASRRPSFEEARCKVGDGRHVVKIDF